MYKMETNNHNLPFEAPLKSNKMEKIEKSILVNISLKRLAEQRVIMVLCLIAAQILQKAVANFW